MKTGIERLSSVVFTYDGTDDQFTEFLKMLIRDYLEVLQPSPTKENDCP